MRARRRRLPRRPHVPRERPRPPPLPLQAPWRCLRRAGTEAAARRDGLARAALPRRSRPHVPRDRRLARDREHPGAARPMTLVQLVFANVVLLLPGALVARALGVRSVSATLAWSLALIFGALVVTFAVGSSLSLTLLLLLAAGVVALRFARNAPRAERIPGRRWVFLSGALLGLLLWHVAGNIGGDGLFHLARVQKLDAFGSLSLDAVNEFADGGLHPGYAFPLWHGFLALVARVGFLDPAEVVLHETTVLAPIALLVTYEAGWAIFRRVSPAVAVVLGAVAVTALAPDHGGAYTALGLPATASRQILLPASLALALAYVERPGRGGLASVAAAGLVLAVVHPTYAIFLWLPFAGFLLVRSLVERARGAADRDRARRPRRPGGGVSRLAAPGRPRHPLARPWRRGAAACVQAVRGTARRLLGHELPAGPRGVRPRRRRRGCGAPLRPARRPRAPAPLGGLRARRLPRRRRGDAGAAALRSLLRPDLDLAVAPRRRLLAAGVLVRRRLRRAGGAAARARPSGGARRWDRAAARLPGRIHVPARGGRPGLRDVVRRRRRGRRARGRACVSETQSPARAAGARRMGGGAVRAPGRRACRRELEPVGRTRGEPAHAGPRSGAARARCARRRRLLRPADELRDRGPRARLHRGRAARSRRRHGEEPPLRAPRRGAALLRDGRRRDPAACRRGLARGRPQAVRRRSAAGQRLPRRPLHALRRAVASGA